MESFFALLQKNAPDRRWTSRKQLRTAIITWTEPRTYHRRSQRRLSKLTPVEDEMLHTKTAQAAPSAGWRSSRRNNGRCAR